VDAGRALAADGVAHDLGVIKALISAPRGHERDAQSHLSTTAWNTISQADVKTIPVRRAVASVDGTSTFFFARIAVAAAAAAESNA
jgi:hypothetical protein